MTVQLTIGEVRFSFMNVFKPRAAKEGQPEKYSVTCLLPKSDTKSYQAIMDAIRVEAQAEQNGKLKGIDPQHVRHPLHDGDGVKADGSQYGEECKGHWVFTASCYPDYPPHVVDSRVQPITDPAQVYSGCYGYVNIGIYAYNNQSKGIAFGLNGLQKRRDGEPLGYAFDAQKAFQAFDDQPAAMPQAVEIDPLTGLPL